MQRLMQLDLDGKTALVTGGGRGIGRAVCVALAGEGARVGVLSRTDTEVQATCQHIADTGAGDAVDLTCDLTDDQAVDRAFARLADAFGQPTIVVHCAARYFQPTKLHNVTAQERAALLRLDVDATVDLFRRSLPAMLDARWGRLVGVGSLAARTGIAGGTLYVAAKSALEGLCRGVALDYSRYGITANVVAAGVTDTERLRRRVADNAQHRQRLERATATRRLPSPDQIADVVVFLCSARASAITGAVIDATAGAHLNNLW